MRPSHQPGAAIDVARRNIWLERFRFYRAPPNIAAIDTWLDRFGDDRDVAARVLDCVDVISEQEIHERYREALGGLKGWHASQSRRKGRWFFVGFGNPGESGPSMLRIFREANGLTQVKYNSLFVGPADLPNAKLTSDDTIVFVDDFSGSGQQACQLWPRFEELIASDATCYLVLTAATEIAMRRIRRETTLTVVAPIVLRNSDNIFHVMCHRFSAADKRTILQYCTTADEGHPRGYGDCGLLFVLSHKTPNNAIPILHIHKQNWKGLFVRYLQMVD